MKKKIRDVRKTEIIEGFYELCKKDGLENTSIAKIGKYLGMPPSLIMHYFPNKRLLILALIDYILKHYQLIYEPLLEKFKDGRKVDSEVLVGRLFSREWNLLFDDGVFYSCYALIFRDPTIKEEYRKLHLELRKTLQEILDKDEYLRKADTAALSEKIFVIIEGAYYYLSMIEDAKEYEEKLNHFKEQAYDLLRLELLPN
ncbi:TetR family transcriptional regulator [Negadavirga shengliensis]|uniref:Biofilm operon icaADBC HTH-type negative transcriptional regulator IcaR n=1 Tax=Negadavirga shengliensis TaxID=1389218 RepID=A0ABV9T442_9BACT